MTFTSCCNWTNCFLLAAAVRLHGHGSVSNAHWQAPSTVNWKTEIRKDTTEYKCKLMIINCVAQLWQSGSGSDHTPAVHLITYSSYLVKHLEAAAWLPVVCGSMVSCYSYTYNCKTVCYLIIIHYITTYLLYLILFITLKH